MSQRVSDLYDNSSDFEELLELAIEAADNGSSDWDCRFVSDIEKKWAEYGLDMFWSNSQDDTLHRIAGDDE